MNRPNLVIKNGKTNFQKFYEGWPHFKSLNVYEDMVVFTLPNPKLAEDSYLKAQQRINELCLPLKAEQTGKLSNTFIVRKALVICSLFLGISFASMAQSKPIQRTNIIVASQGRKVVLTTADTAYLTHTTKSIRSAIYNYRTGGIIKNNDIADMILTLLKK